MGIGEAALAILRDELYNHLKSDSYKYEIFVVNIGHVAHVIWFLSLIFCIDVYPCTHFLMLWYILLCTPFYFSLHTKCVHSIILVCILHVYTLSYLHITCVHSAIL